MDVWCLGIPTRLVWWQPYFVLLILVVYHVSSARMFPAGGASLFPIPKYSRIVSAWDPQISGSLFPGNSHATEIWNLASVGSLWKNGENGGFGYGGPIFGDGSTAMSLNAIDDFIWKRATPESHGLSVHQHFPYWNCHLGPHLWPCLTHSTATSAQHSFGPDLWMFPIHGDSMHTHIHIDWIPLKGTWEWANLVACRDPTSFLRAGCEMENLTLKILTWNEALHSTWGMEYPNDFAWNNWNHPSLVKLLICTLPSIFQMLCRNPCASLLAVGAFKCIRLIVFETIRKFQKFQYVPKLDNRVNSSEKYCSIGSSSTGCAQLDMNTKPGWNYLENDMNAK